MNLFNKKIHLGAKVLQQLITSENSNVEVVQRERDLRTLPYHGNNFSSATKEQLNALVGKFVKDLNGVVLGYKNIKILSSLALIDDDGLNNFSIRADFFVFKPVPGNELQAVVTKKSNDHVGCLVYNTFNMSIPKPAGVVNWTGNNVEIGQEITARVTYVKLEARIPYIRGEFIEKSSVNRKIKFSDDEEEKEDRNIDEDGRIQIDSDTQKSSKKKKISRRSLENGINEMMSDEKSLDGNGSMQINSDTENTSKKKKSSRRSLENGINKMMPDENSLDKTSSMLIDTDTEHALKKKKRSSRNVDNNIDENMSVEPSQLKQDYPNEVSKEPVCDFGDNSVRNKRKKPEKSIEQDDECLVRDRKKKKRRSSSYIEEEVIMKKRKVA